MEGVSRSAVGYSKRYFGPYPQHNIWRFIHGVFPYFNVQCNTVLGGNDDPVDSKIMEKSLEKALEASPEARGLQK